MYRCFCWAAQWSGSGAGRRSFPCPISVLPCVLALPATGVSTPQAYRDWDALQAASPALTPGPLSYNQGVESVDRCCIWRTALLRCLLPGEDRAEDPLLALVRTGIENDFEQVVFPQYPFLGEIKRILVGGSRTEDAAIYAGLSGSGSALFGLYRTPGAAQAALERLERHGVTGLVTSTLPRSDYWRTMMVADAA